ncbi:MAG: hypothetical protein LM577_08100 [Thermoproteaceae archaeon]|nr:hypothetical protein [Thermoproteaceae archaeon]
MAEKIEGKVRNLVEAVGDHVVIDVTLMYRALCRLMAWRPRTGRVVEYITRYIGDLELALRQLTDSGVLDYYPDTPSAHRYLAALSAVMEALSYCAGALFCALGRFLVYGSAEPVAGAVCDAFPRLCTG